MLNLHPYFKGLGRLEAISFLILLGIAMPLKYIWGFPVATRIAGSIHGLFFILYVISATQIAPKLKWDFKTRLCSYGVAVLPFGPFIFEAKILKNKN